MSMLIQFAVEVSLQLLILSFKLSDFTFLALIQANHAHILLVQLLHKRFKSKKSLRRKLIKVLHR